MRGTWARRFSGLALALGLALLVSWGACADVRGMVIRMQGERIVINMGLQKDMRPGQILFIYDGSGNPVAQVKVTQVDDYSSEVAIVKMAPSASLNVGNNVSDRAFADGALDKPVASASRAPEVAGTPIALATPGLTPSPSPAAVSADPTKAFEALLKSRTKIYAFHGGKGGVVKINPNDVLNLLSTVVTVGRGSPMTTNPVLLTTTAYEYWERYSATANMNQKARTTIEVVYWDDGLANAYADYYVFKETYLDAARKAETRAGLLSQKGVTTNAVFQVRIRNRGPGTLQISPFDWHFYLLDAEGNRVKAERYDEVLDKSLAVGQDVQGYVYFPKRDPLGRPYVGEPVKVMMEDVFGERTQITWVTRSGVDSGGATHTERSQADDRDFNGP